MPRPTAQATETPPHSGSRQPPATQHHCRPAQTPHAAQWQSRLPQVTRCRHSQTPRPEPTSQQCSSQSWRWCPAPRRPRCASRCQTRSPTPPQPPSQTETSRPHQTSSCSRGCPGCSPPQTPPPRRCRRCPAPSARCSYQAARCPQLPGMAQSQPPPQSACSRSQPCSSGSHCSDTHPQTTARCAPTDGSGTPHAETRSKMHWLQHPQTPAPHTAQPPSRRGAPPGSPQTHRHHDRDPRSLAHSDPHQSCSSQMSHGTSPSSTARPRPGGRRTPAHRTRGQCSQRRHRSRWSRRRSGSPAPPRL